MKICSKCRNLFDLTFFYKDKAFKSGLRSACKACDNKKTRLNYLKNNKYRNKELSQKYGIDEHQYNVMLIEQKYSCLICKTHRSNFTYSLCVDHCHTTGKVRGLLCKPCNLIIGNALDKIDVLKEAIIYLEASCVK